MTILDTDPTNGWVRGACPPVITCPGAAGYALDASDILMLPRGIIYAGGNYIQINAATGERVDYGSSGISASSFTYGGKFGRGYNTAYIISAGSSISCGNIASGTPITVRGFINTDNSNNINVLFFSLCDVTKVSGSNKGISLCWSYRDLLLMQGNPVRETTLLTMSNAITSYWSYITMQKNGSTITIFVDGAQKGQITIPGTQNAAYTIYPVLAPGTPAYGSMGFFDINVSQTIRNGTFVPGDNFGY